MLADLSIAAESLAHSVPISAGGMLFAENHLVIEVAFFGPSGRSFLIAPEHFTLTINGKRIPLLPDPAGVVAGSMRDSIWNQGPNLEASGSIGNSGVVLGRRHPDTGVPDLDRAGRDPQMPRAPGQENRSGVPPKQRLDIPAELELVTLTRCECKVPVAGLLYFPYRGKLKAIQSMILHYTAVADGPTLAIPINP